MTTQRMFELMSTMQKAIRRSDELLAMRAAVELHEAGRAGVVASRLKITIYEDVGVGDPQAAMFALRCIEDYIAWNKAGKDADLLALANCILTLARSTKCRAGDDFQAAARWQNLEHGPVEIPDYAYDMHTRKGKAMGRGLDHFLAEGAKLVGGIESGFETDARKFFEHEISNRKPRQKKAAVADDSGSLWDKCSPGRASCHPLNVS